jgi:hypothetical protein
MTEYDVSDLISRARNSLENDLTILAAYTAVARGISELPEGTELPENELFFAFGFGPLEKEGKIVQNPVIEEVRRDFGLHSSRYAVLAMIPAFEVYLERIHWISLLLNHATSQGAEVSGENVQSMRERSLRIALGKNPPQMIKEILSNVAHHSPIELFDWIVSIYSARKILSLRNGNVSGVDTNTEGKFKLLRRTVDVVENEDGVRVLRTSDVEREYEVGTELKITPKDCQEIAFALISVADEITIILSDKGREFLEAG